MSTTTISGEVKGIVPDERRNKITLLVGNESESQWVEYRGKTVRLLQGLKLGDRIISHYRREAHLSSFRIPYNNSIGVNIQKEG